jgi:hypothetical protein
MFEISFPIFPIQNARDHSGMLEKKSPEPPEDRRVSGRNFVEKQLLKSIYLSLFSPHIIRALYELGDSRGFSPPIFHFDKYSGIPQYSNNSDPPSLPASRGSSRILAVPRDQPRESSASSGVAENYEKQRPKITWYLSI